jgi:hypothetical protein
MPARFSDAVANRQLDLLLGASYDTTAMPATVYIALVTTAPSDANGTGLVEGTGADWGTVVGWAIYTAATAGTFKAYSPLAVSQVMSNGSGPWFFAPGGLTIYSPGT